MVRQPGLGAAPGSETALVRSPAGGGVAKSPESRPWAPRAAQTGTFPPPGHHAAVGPAGFASCHLRQAPNSPPTAFTETLHHMPKGRDHSRPLRFSAWRRYHVRRDISSLSQGFLASMVRARSSIRGRPFLASVSALSAAVNYLPSHWGLRSHSDKPSASSDIPCVCLILHFSYAEICRSSM